MRLGFLLSLVLLVGCTSTVAGTGRPGEPTPPAQLELRGVDVCSLIPRSAWPELHSNGPGRLEAQEQGCVFNTASGMVSVQVDTTKGLGAYRNLKLQDMAPVRGYRTVRSDGPPNFCPVLADVHRSQLLAAGALMTSQQDQSCRIGHRLIEIAADTLIARG